MTGLPRVEGLASRQAHADLPAGTYEREIGRDGFYGAATHMYHRHPPTGWSGWEGPLRPRAVDCRRLAPSGPSPWGAAPLLTGRDVAVRLWSPVAAMDHLVRNGDGDELVFVHAGSGDLFCDYGHLAYAEGDYLLLPRGTMWRLAPAEPSSLLLIEATGDALRLPDRGTLGRHAVFDPGMLETPHLDQAFADQGPERSWQVAIKRRGRISTVTYPFNPLDAVGWKGDLVPLRLNLRDIRPVVSARYHLPPSVHATFAASGFVVCSFCPRPLETDPGALKLPFFHSNDDYDEMIFYHRGRFTSRDGIAPGMITLHPAGFTHGPHPKAFAAAQHATPARTETDEYAVMIDSRQPLDLAPAACAAEWAGYADSWMG